MTPRRQALFLLILAIAHAQTTAPLTNGSELQRARIDSDPMTILTRLQSGNASERVLAVRSLGFTVSEDDIRFAPQTQLFLDNLDDDDDLEAVLAFAVTGAAIVVVLDKGKDSWWRVGRFSNAWREAGDLHETVRLQDVIENGRAEVIIRERAGGTDISETHLSFYRLQGGQLRRVLRVTERSRYRLVGAQHQGTSVYERAWLSYPAREDVGDAIVILDTNKTVIGPASKPPLDRRFRLRAATCEIFKWNQKLQEFVVDRSIARKFCDSPAAAVNLGGSGVVPTGPHHP